MMYLNLHTLVSPSFSGLVVMLILSIEV